MSFIFCSQIVFRRCCLSIAYWMTFENNFVHMKYFASRKGLKQSPLGDLYFISFLFRETRWRNSCKISTREFATEKTPKKSIEEASVQPATNPRE